MINDNCLAIGIFSECFKTAEVIPTYKKDKPTEKTNYRLNSILSNERLMHDNMSDYFWKRFWCPKLSVIYDRHFTKNS